MKLTKEQRKLLVTWAAEGLTLREINERADKCDPPFEVDWIQLKHVRTRTNKTYGQLREEFEREAVGEGLARRAVRIRQLEELFDRHIELIKARGEELGKDKVAGGATGLLVKDYKGKDADTAIYKYDAALIREMRGIFDDIARELGERKNKVELSGPDGAMPALNIYINGLPSAPTPGPGVPEPGE